MEKYKILNEFNNAKSVCLIGHITPDADALCSMVVFRNFLKKHFNLSKVDIFAESNILSDTYLPILGQLKINKKISTYDTAVMMDSPNVERVGIYKPLFEKAKRKIVIDHHDTNNKDGDINIVEIVSSTCEIVYNILKEFHYKLSNEEYGKIYSGIITDTNNFSVGAITPTTFKIASDCFPHINYEQIYSHFFSNNTLKNMSLMSLAIQNITTFKHGKILMTHITREDAEKFKAKPDDYIGITNRIASISGNKLVCFIHPKDDYYYVSMRAKRGFDVAVVAKKFNGGGHVGASAFNSKKQIFEIETDILKEFEIQINNTKEQPLSLF